MTEHYWADQDDLCSYFKYPITKPPHHLYPREEIDFFIIIIIDANQVFESSHLSYNNKLPVSNRSHDFT